jgi:hypothetical protein
MGVIKMSTYSSNISALKKTHVYLVEKLKKNKLKTEWIFPRDKGFNVKNDSNEIVRGDSSDETGRVLESYQFHDDEASIVFGIGTGNFLFDLCKKKKSKHSVILFETQLDILKTAFENYNYSKWIKDGSLLFITESGDELSSLIGFIDSNLVIQDWMFFAEPYVFHKHSIYGKDFKHAHELVNHLRCNTGTVMQAGAIIAENDILNLPYVIRHNGINVLKNAFLGKPAVLVSTGPSLANNVHKLKAVRDNVIVIAVAQALRILLSYDIKPDFICTVDFGEVNLTHFRGLMNSDVPLIALNRSYAPIIRSWAGPKFISAGINPGCEDNIVGLLDDRGSLEQGGSVAHFAFGLALHFGCNPIIMIGQDLALTDGLSHNPNADSAGSVFLDGNTIKWAVTDPRSDTLNKDLHSMGELVKIPGYMGGEVMTNIGLASFITAFDDIIKRKCDDITVINATEGGARIPRTKQMSLSMALSQYATNEIDKSIIANYSGLKDDYIEDIERAIKLIDKDIEILKNVINESEHGLKYNQELTDIQNSKCKKSELEKIMNNNAVHSNKANELADKVPLLKLHIYHASRAIQNRDLKVDGALNHLYENRNDLSTRIKRNRLILEQAAKSSKELIESYTTTKELLEKYLETRDNNLLESIPEYIPSLDDAEKYFSMGNWARPYLDAMILNNQEILNKCIDMRNKKIKEIDEKNVENDMLIEYNELVYNARNIGLENHDYDRAFELLDEAEKMYPEKFDAQWGRATALFHIGRHDDALRQYDKLVKNHPDLDRIQFERCLVFMEINPEQGIENMIDFLSTHDSFQYFWRHIGSVYESTDTVKALSAYKLYIEKYPEDKNILARIKAIE